MLIKRKRIRSHLEDRWLALVLATSAGTLNAMALGAFGFFPSHMSGNTSQISTEVSTSNLKDLVFLTTILIAFIAGAFSARVTVAAGLNKKLRTIYCLILLAEGAALALLSLFELRFYTAAVNRESVVFLAFLMGIHNATSTQLSNGRVRSTHITGTVTDAGIALGSVVAGWLSRNDKTGWRSQYMVLSTHLTTLFSFVAGGIGGLLLYRLAGFSAMLAVGVFLMVVATSAIVIALYTTRKRRIRSNSPQNA
ncbi:hypothetical protein BL250_05115 [Erwinia sp. OLTSP20]|uniref:YoaK family protein n=1 Tax=unclassified Erwinia TaxID=2622719 RepID=UPI000C19D5CE|nr:MULTISPECIES: YoaK family protein [unclassified Erwinia]PIJ50948.1 DUF1275 family protein [Erwinia sp. OAMSP11]PIJ75924.1 hypothetical protein BK416_00070 [Erwinia sp. OLSSP12]PIJ83630.1 hypothetical protein BLD47_04265 [Erwinia sp. OLCASP19]PIJ87486.1 hypothetical protein BLD46_00640 [Erwinia sp. OLMTSP26]PIJ89034.1 hypothetical protein BLD49_00635 [Erwinia sp. OLMDSP33]